MTPSLFNIRSSTSTTQSTTTTPLRVNFNIENALTTGATITLTLGSGFSGANSVASCTIRSTDEYGAPMVLQGSYSLTNKAFTITLLSGLNAGSYLIEVKNILVDAASEGFSYSTVTSMVVAISSSSGNLIAQDMISINPAPSKNSLQKFFK